MKKLHARASQFFNKIAYFQLSLRQTKILSALTIAALIYADVRYNNYYAFNSLIAMMGM